MYLNYFNLKKEPFNITPDPELLFLSPSHKEALAAVIYGVKQRKGFVAIVGEVGVGKTTIIRSFLDRIDREQVKTIYIFNSNISFKALIKTIYHNMGQTPETDDVFEMVNQLHRMLIDEYKAGRNIVLIIDEIQNMPVATLENLRMLSNLETSKDKLIQIIFSGQPEFEEKLELHVLRQLRQRIAVKVNIMPLTREESLAYIHHRLSRTMQKEPDIFTRGALETIVHKAGGIPRVINILCDNCLITSFGKQQKQVTARVAREIIRDLKMSRPLTPWWRLAFLLPLIAAVLAFWIYGPKKAPATLSGSALPVQASRDAVAEAAPQPPPAPVKAPVQQPEEKMAAAEAPADNGTAFKIARKGDTLAKLTLEKYGSVNRRLLNLVKRHNPSINDIDVIQEGKKIYFPATAE